MRILTTCSSVDFNPLSPCGERLMVELEKNRISLISIHSPRAGRDTGAPQLQMRRDVYFNPLSPCGERQVVGDSMSPDIRISIHSPRAGRDGGWTEVEADSRTISIHSPRAGRDFVKTMGIMKKAAFQSTLPVRGETFCIAVSWLRSYLISIHSPRAGRDLTYDDVNLPVINISIHSPRAGRDRKLMLSPILLLLFQSTLPVRGETW